MYLYILQVKQEETRALLLLGATETLSLLPLLAGGGFACRRVTCPASGDAGES